MVEVDLASLSAGFLSSAFVAAICLSRCISERRSRVSAEEKLKAEIERRALAEAVAQDGAAAIETCPWRIVRHATAGR